MGAAEAKPEVPAIMAGKHFQPGRPETQSEISGEILPKEAAELQISGIPPSVRYISDLRKIPSTVPPLSEDRPGAENRCVSEQPTAGGWKLNGLAACGSGGATLTMCGLTA